MQLSWVQRTSTALALVHNTCIINTCADTAVPGINSPQAHTNSFNARRWDSESQALVSTQHRNLQLEIEHFIRARTNPQVQVWALLNYIPAYSWHTLQRATSKTCQMEVRWFSQGHEQQQLKMSLEQVRLFSCII